VEAKCALTGRAALSHASSTPALSTVLPLVTAVVVAVAQRHGDLLLPIFRAPMVPSARRIAELFALVFTANRDPPVPRQTSRHLARNLPMVTLMKIQTIYRVCPICQPPPLPMAYLLERFVSRKLRQLNAMAVLGEVFVKPKRPASVLESILTFLSLLLGNHLLARLGPPVLRVLPGLSWVVREARPQ
jgi:hypothetical protein